MHRDPKGDGRSTVVHVDRVATWLVTDSSWTYKEWGVGVATRPVRYGDNTFGLVLNSEST